MNTRVTERFEGNYGETTVVRIGTVPDAARHIATVERKNDRTFVRFYGERSRDERYKYEIVGNIIRGLGRHTGTVLGTTYAPARVVRRSINEMKQPFPSLPHKSQPARAHTHARARLFSSVGLFKSPAAYRIIFVEIRARA